jgi:hypothetical protein
MLKMFRGATAFAVTAVTAAVMSAGTTAAQADDMTWAGCPYGSVCIYPQDQNPAVSPSHIFTAYGAHNLSNQHGNHWVLNNQYGGAFADLCHGYDATRCISRSIHEGAGVYADLTPINSVWLWTA